MGGGGCSASMDLLLVVRWRRWRMMRSRVRSVQRRIVARIIPAIDAGVWDIVRCKCLL